MDKLDLLNFSYYAFHWDSPRLSPEDQKKALCLTVALGVFLGFGHLVAAIVYAVNRDEIQARFKRIDSGEEPTKITDVGANVLLNKQKGGVPETAPSGGTPEMPIDHPIDLPPYAKLFYDDLSISKECRELFKRIFVDVINPRTIEAIQPLGKLVEKDGEIAKKLEVFNQTHFGSDTSKHLGCRGSQHSSNEKDPWQTIKITAPNISELGKTSPILLELKKNLDKHYHLKSGGGGNWQEWLKLSFAEKMQKDKYDPVCFKEGNTTMAPQLMLTLIDLRKILGLIKSDEDYIKALGDAYNRP